MENQHVNVRCSVDDLVTEGFVERRDLDQGERFRRAAKVFGVCFGIACLTVFIPILHFVLPPLFLLLGGFLATTTWLQKSEVMRGEITCPNCKKKMVLTRGPEEWPRAQRCEGCAYSLSVQRL